MERRRTPARGVPAPPRWIALSWAILTLAVLPPSVAESNSLRQILELHVARYPQMETDDLYKLLYQAALGNQHAITDREAARQWLLRELEVLAARGTGFAGEPLTEPLSPDGRLVRVNLRPFLGAGGDPETLLEAFVETSERYRGDFRTLERYCNVAVALAEDKVLPFSATELEERFADLRQQGYPTMHHTDRYGEAHRPAYRVVLLELLPAD